MQTIRSRYVSSAALLALSGALVLFGASCSSCTKSSGTQSAREDVALMPKESGVLAMVNVGRIRDTSAWRKMLDLRDQAATERKKAAAQIKEEPKAGDAPAPRDYDEFVAMCGLDPFKQIDSALVALPSQTGEGEFAAVLHGTFDEGKLLACGRAMAKKQGAELAESEYDGKKMYNDASSGQLFVSFLDGKTVLLGGKEWIKKSLDLATGKGETKESAKDNAPLMDLMKKARTSDGMWAVGLVSDRTREELKNNEKLASAGSIKDLYASLDFASGMTLQATVDLGSEADAQDVTKKIGEQLGDAKKNGQIMMMGLASYIDAIKVDSQGAAFRVNTKLNPQQVDDLVNRIQGALKALGGAARGGMMPGMGGVQ